jgi:site-specific DNA-methyltransferase (adenine-specific)
MKVKEYTGRANIKLINADCMDILPDFKMNEFDLAIVDPPYGRGQDGTIGFANKKTKGFNFNKKEYKQKNWDQDTPSVKYFDYLFNISENQIIWGANYFNNKIPIINNFIYWHKKGLSKDTKFNEGELAYTSIGISRMVDIWWNGFGTINSNENRFHPTQKPVKLYKWILSNYSNQWQTILDTHFGSLSIGIACWDLGFDLVAIEKDSEYFDKAVERFEIHIAQKQLF